MSAARVAHLIREWHAARVDGHPGWDAYVMLKDEWTAGGERCSDIAPEPEMSTDTPGACACVVCSLVGELELVEEQA